MAQLSSFETAAITSIDVDVQTSCQTAVSAGKGNSGAAMGFSGDEDYPGLEETRKRPFDEITGDHLFPTQKQGRPVAECNRISLPPLSMPLSLGGPQVMPCLVPILMWHKHEFLQEPHLSGVLASRMTQVMTLINGQLYEKRSV
jgi:hypothetical protein